MSLEQLWAGWRAAYVASVTGPEPAPGEEALPPAGQGAPRPLLDGADPACVFCHIAASPEHDSDHYVLWRSSNVVAVLNAYPYAPGHLMVMPTRHLGALELLTAEESAELWSACQAAVRALKSAYSPEGLNLGANLGRAAGAGIPAHLHVHAVPRWLGDTNFMTTVAATRVMPEAISDSWTKLAAAWPR